MLAVTQRTIIFTMLPGFDGSNIPTIFADIQALATNNLIYISTWFESDFSNSGFTITFFTTQDADVLLLIPALTTETSSAISFSVQGLM